MPDLYIYTVLDYYVIDGDTVKVLLDTGFRNRTITSVRVEGINTPEKRGKEKEAGLAVKEIAEMWIKKNCSLDIKKKRYFLDSYPIKGLYVRSVKLDKYGGRIIGRIFTENDADLGDFLIAEGLARIYDGGSKLIFEGAEIDVVVDRCNKLKEKWAGE